MNANDKYVGGLPGIISNFGPNPLYQGHLKPYFRVVLRSRGARNPYHNFRHSFEVFWKCGEALAYYRAHPELLEYVIDLRRARAFMLAAMLHDLDHPGRSGNDDLSIELANRAVEKCLLPEDLQFLDEIKFFIRTTEFGATGHVYAVGSRGREYEELEKVLRDADISQCFGFAWIQLICHGLGDEMGISPEDMLRGQPGYLRNFKMQSKWGQATYTQEAIESKLAEAQALVELLDVKG